MSYPSQIDLAVHTLHFLRGIEHGPVPSQPGVNFEPDLGRKLTTQEEELKKIAIEKVCEYLSQPGFGTAPQPQRMAHPIAMMLAGAPGADEDDQPEPPPEEGPGSTESKPKPAPDAPGDDLKKPENPKTEEKKPEKEKVAV